MHNAKKKRAPANLTSAYPIGRDGYLKMPFRP